MCDDRTRAIGGFLHKAFDLLQSGGVVFIATPSIDSWSARLLGRRWMELKAEHLFYFSRNTITRQLAAAGFAASTLHPGVKKLSFDYIAAHFEKYPVAGITPALRLLRALLPAAWCGHPFSVVASGLIAVARKPAASA